MPEESKTTLGEIMFDNFIEATRRDDPALHDFLVAVRSENERMRAALTLIKEYFDLEWSSDTGSYAANRAGAIARGAIEMVTK